MRNKKPGKVELKKGDRIKAIYFPRHAPDDYVKCLIGREFKFLVGKKNWTGSNYDHLQYELYCSDNVSFGGYLLSDDIICIKIVNPSRTEKDLEIKLQHLFEKRLNERKQ